MSVFCEFKAIDSLRRRGRRRKKRAASVRICVAFGATI